MHRPKLFTKGLAATGLAFLLSCAPAPAQENIWIHPATDHWHKAKNWSLGEPTADHWAMITNAGSKAVGIIPGKPATVGNFTIDAPDGFQNALLLGFTRRNSPFRVRNHSVIGPNGSVLSLYGGFVVDGSSFPALTIDGILAQEGGFWGVTNGGVLVNSNGAIHLSGDCRLNTLFVEGGSFHQGGGFATVSNLFLRSDATAKVSNGVLKGTIVVGDAAQSAGTFQQFGGIVRVDPEDLSGLPNAFFLERGTSLLVGGTIDGNVSLLGSPAVFTQSNGVVRGNVELGPGFTYPFYEFRGGKIRGGVRVFNGSFTQWGGLIVASNRPIEVLGAFDSTGPTTFPSYTMNGGNLFCSTLRLQEYGGFVQNNGTNDVAGDIHISAGGYNLNAGTVISSNLSLSSVALADDFLYFGGFYQAAGVHKISGVLSNSGIYQVDGGSLEVGDIHLIPTLPFGTGLFLVFNGPNVVNTGRFVHGGVLHVSGSSPQFGELHVSSPSPSFEASWIMFHEGPNIVRFAGSAPVWASDAVLRISGWKGSVTGGGTDQLFIGNSSNSLTAEQLARIQFDFPYGSTAKILETGEIVPDRPLLGSRIEGANLVLTWLAPTVSLETSTNVNGPYVEIPATSPYTNISAEFPQRFFRLKANW